MAEGSEDDKERKTLEPSAKRLRDAYEKGQVPISRELSNFAFLSACLVVCAWVLPICFKKTLKFLATFISVPGELRVEDGGGLSFIYAKVVMRIVEIFWPPFAILAVAALIGGLGQTYRGVRLKNVGVKLSRISLKSGIKRVFSFASVFEALKAVVKIAALCAIFYLAFKDEANKLNALVWATPVEYAEVLRSSLVKFMGAVLIGYAFLSAFDVWYQRFRFRQNLRMTPQEMKEEHKESEGDPQIRGKIRELRNRRTRERMLGKIPEATVIVTNPTHYSVALAWDEEGQDAPTVVAKGVDALAMKIRELAKEHEVPIVENPVVARSLYDSVDIDRQIPPEYYKVVAEVIRVAMNVKRRRF